MTISEPNRMALIKLHTDTILAPMAEITDVAFRTLCKQYGCGLTFTEMISANDLARNEAPAIKELKQLASEPKPRGVQLYGRNMDNFITATKMVQPYAEVLDLNFGCPYYKLILQGTGCALMERPGKIRQIVQNVVANSKIPVSCKIRLGMDAKNITVIKVAQKCEESGASMLTVHPRTQKQEYGGKADWSWIKKVKETVKIPVCGNGDVRTVEDYLRMKKETGCDYAMIGRGAIGNPFIFQQINKFNKTGKYRLPTTKDRLTALYQYLEIAEQFQLEFKDVKKQAMYFLERTFPDRSFKPGLEKVSSSDSLNKLLEKLSREQLSS